MSSLANNNFKEVVFDIDTTILPTYGKPSGSEYIHHYQAVGYHPMLCYDGNTGDLLKAELREGSKYCGNGAADFIKPLLAEYQQDYPEIQILVRGDSGFAMPDLYECVEEFAGAGYIIRLKENSVLQDKVQDEVSAFMKDTVKAKSLSKPRYVEVCEIELHQTEGANELFPTCTFIVTNPELVYLCNNVGKRPNLL